MLWQPKVLSKLMAMERYGDKTVAEALAELENCNTEQKIQKWNRWLQTKDEIVSLLFPLLLDFEKHMRSSDDSFVLLKGSWFKMVAF